jgi:hypothetical protein
MARGLKLGRAAILGVCAMLASSSCAFAVQLYYDPFNIGPDPAAGQYTVGPVSGQNPTIGPTPFFTGAWSTQVDAANGAVQASGLSYLGVPAPGGSQVANPNSRPQRSLSTPWTSTTTGTYYLGFFANFGQGAGTAGNDMGYRAIEFRGDAGAFQFNIAYNTYSSAIGPQQQDPTTAQMFLGLNGDHILDGAPDSFTRDGLTHLLVVRFNLSATTASDSISVYLDPTNSVEPDLPAASVSGIDFTFSSMGGMTLFGGSGTFPALDELRVGTTFADAVPIFPVPGDTDGDGDVDLIDYQHIFDNFNKTGQDTLHGDVALSNGTQGTDGKVDLGDLHLWKSHYPFPGAGSGSTLGTGSVPEPSSLKLMLTVAAVGLGIRHQIV